ncbi:MAG: DUF3575 domain-containing protein [Ginsengibacter sp.]
MSKLKYALAILLLIFCLNLNGQSVSDNPGIATGRLNFTGIVDVFDENISIGGEYRLKDHWSIGTDVAYVYNSLYLSQSKTVRGYIVRPFIRYYPDQHRTGFFEAQLNYKYVAYHITDWIDRGGANGMPAYQEYTTFRYNKRVYGINIIAGTKENLSRNKRLKIELYLGIGYRYKKQDADIGTYLRQRGNNLSIYRPEYSTLVLPLGASLIYDFK